MSGPEASPKVSFLGSCPPCVSRRGLSLAWILSSSLGSLGIFLYLPCKAVLSTPTGHMLATEAFIPPHPAPCDPRGPTQPKHQLPPLMVLTYYPKPRFVVGTGPGTLPLLLVQDRDPEAGILWPSKKNGTFPEPQEQHS